MRSGVWISVAIVGVIAAVVTTGTVASVISERQAAAGAVHGDGLRDLSCNAALGPTDVRSDLDPAAAARGLSPQQRDIVEKIIGIGKRRELSPRAWQVAIQAGMTESRLHNATYGDRDSLGVFQMRPSMGWGSRQEVTNVEYAINKFYDVLQSVSGWKHMRPGEAAQAVERSAFPTRYHRWEAMAAYLVENVGDIEDATGCGAGTGMSLPHDDGTASTVIEYAMDQIGDPYVWGAEGPDAFDCSGLVLKAFQQAGITMPRVAEDQYHAGALLPVEEAEPGDLLFWAYDPSDPRTIHHVAIYLGNGKIVEAEQTGVPVQVDTFSWDGAQLVPQAVRPAV